MVFEERLQLHWRPFRFALPRPLVTAHGALAEKRGWLLRLEAGDGRIGWGEAAALDWHQAAAQRPPSAAAANAAPAQGESAADPIDAARLALGSSCRRSSLEALLPSLPGPLAFALGLALAELDGLGAQPRGWLAPPPSAHLLPAGEAMPAAWQALLHADPAGVAPTPPAADSLAPAPGHGPIGWPGSEPPIPFTVKWKVAAGDDRRERQLLEWLLEQLPAQARLRLDANGGWDRATAGAWAERLAAEPRLEWLEQPLAAADGEGLLALAQRLPVALDESLHPAAGSGLEAAGAALAGALDLEAWPGWLVRRPALEGDPRPLLAQLQAGRPRLMLSTALETGIGMRLLAHLAALQRRGPTPTAAGLAPGWRPQGGLFATEPREVWRAAAELA